MWASKKSVILRRFQLYTLTLVTKASEKRYSQITDFLPGKWQSPLKIGFSEITFFWMHFVADVSLHI
jgi:hypothetical protein